MGSPVLGQRALNRATLARQLLLERSSMSVEAAVAQLAGLQAQTTHTWYVGLWTRLTGLDPVAVGELLERRELVRLPVMRSTIHLLTAEDALALRPLTLSPDERATLGHFNRLLVGVDRDKLVAAADGFVTEKPRLASELGRLLEPLFPGVDREALAQAARAWLPMVQVPPRGVWGRSGQARQASLETWLGRPQSAMTVDELVRRYLAAFGPATVKDAQIWSGLTKLAEVFARLDLRTFRGENGAELFDLPDAPRPGPDVAAPVRFLYDYDNLLLSHADRSRVTEGADYAAHGYTIEANRQPSSVLVDGMVAGTWTVTAQRGSATLSVRAFGEFSSGVRAEIEAEGARLLDFLHTTGKKDIQVS